MGIHGLSGYLKWKTARVRRTVTWAPGTEAAGTRWAIDCSPILYKARGAGLSQISVMASLIVRIRRAGAEPIVIFDGRAPAAKREVIERRQVARAAARERVAVLEAEMAARPDMTVAERGEREVEIATLQATAPTVTRVDRDNVKQFLYAAGVLGITAAGEADDLLAWLARTGAVSAVVSGDYDMLARGVPVLVVPETPDTSVCMRIELSAVLSELRITYPAFLVACARMGSDYAATGRAETPVAAALERARAGDTGDDIAAEIAMLRGDDVIWGPRLLDERQMAKWAAGAPSMEPEPMERLFAAHGWPREWRAQLLPA
jgi:hypothetical protein